MTKIEMRILQGLNNSIDKIKPDNLISILNTTECTNLKDSNKRKFQVFRRKAIFAAIAIGFIAVTIHILPIAKNNKIITDNHAGNLSNVSLPNYKSRITMPSYTLLFNEGIVPSSNMLCFSKIVPLYSKSDIVKEFGFDPLANLWVPPDMKSCFSSQSKTNPYYNHAYYFSGSRLYWLNSSYRENPDDHNSKAIIISLSHNHPITFTLEPRGTVEVSHIYNTDVIVTHQPKGVSKLFPNEMFSAKFTYNNVGYSIITDNGVSQSEFINVLTSIIKS